jgi:uncharacterized protein (TIGR02147 family)
MPDPLLYEHTDYREYLRRTLEARQISQRSLARALERTEGSISQILSERRGLSPALVEPLAGFLELDADEHAYLAALVDLHNDSPRARRTAWATVQANLQHRVHSERLAEEWTRLASSWVMGTVYQLARCEGFQGDPEWIAARAAPQITVREAEEALTVLLSIGYVTPTEDGRLEAVVPAWMPSDLPQGVLSDAVHRLQLETMEIARGAYERFPVRQRHMSSTYFALSERQYEHVQARVRELERELVMMSLQEDGARTRVYQLGFQLFPVSAATCDDEE